MIGGVRLLIVDEMLGQGTWRSIAQTTRSVSQVDSLAAPLGCVLLDALFGGLRRADPPHRILPAHPIPGLSVLVAQLVTGTLMRRYADGVAALGAIHRSWPPLQRLDVAFIICDCATGDGAPGPVGQAPHARRITNAEAVKGSIELFAAPPQTPI